MVVKVCGGGGRVVVNGGPAVKRWGREDRPGPQGSDNDGDDDHERWWANQCHGCRQAIGDEAPSWPQRIFEPEASRFFLKYVIRNKRHKGGDRMKERRRKREDEREREVESMRERTSEREGKRKRQRGKIGR